MADARIAYRRILDELVRETTDDDPGAWDDAERRPADAELYAAATAARAAFRRACEQAKELPP